MLGESSVQAEKIEVGCTWEDCTKIGEFKQIAADGEVWAILCTEHNEIMDVETTDLKPKSFISNWIKAQGGAKAAAKRMIGE